MYAFLFLCEFSRNHHYIRTHVRMCQNNMKNGTPYNQENIITHQKKM